MQKNGKTADEDASGSWPGRSVLVTGGLGFIGSNLARYLVSQGADVTVVDNLLPGSGAHRFNLQGFERDVRILVADLRDADALVPIVKNRDYIFNLAGQTSHAESITDPLGDLDLNCRAHLTLLESCRRFAAHAKVIYTSTRQVYGRNRTVPVDETHPTDPIDINGIHKLAAEHYHHLYAKLYGMRVTVLRVTNVFGPRMRVKDGRQNFLGLWIRLALEKQPFEVWGGDQQRDLLYVDDCTRALAAAALAPSTEGGTFNLGGHDIVRLSDLAKQVVTAAEGGSYVVTGFPEDRRKIDIGDYYADTGKFKAAVDWRFDWNLDAGLRRTSAYYRDHLHRYL